MAGLGFVQGIAVFVDANPYAVIAQTFIIFFKRRINSVLRLRDTQNGSFDDLYNFFQKKDQFCSEIERYAKWQL